MKKLIIILFLLLSVSKLYGAIGATCVWEFRPGTGSADNGGGYTSGGTDYSQQAAAQLSLTDFAATDAAGTTLTTATGGFTAAMVGNIIYLHDADDNLTNGWYEITAYTSTNEVTIDRDCTDGDGGDMTGGDGKVGGALDILTDAFLDDTDVVVPGQTIYVKNDGTMTTGADISLANVDGTTTLPIYIEGYNSSRDDNPTGTDMPLIACAASAFHIGDYFEMKNFRMTSSHASGLNIDAGSRIHNVAIDSSVGNGIRISGNFNEISNCTITSGTQGVYIIGGGNKIYGNYIYSTGSNGIYLSADYTVIVDNIITGSADYGINVGARQFTFIYGNTFSGNGSHDIYITTGSVNTISNNIFDGSPVGVEATGERHTNYCDYNCWNATDDIVDTDVVMGDNAVDADPLLNANFTLQVGSPCLDAGMQITSIAGADFKVNIGADQDDVTGAFNVIGGTVVK